MSNSVGIYILKFMYQQRISAIVKTNIIKYNSSLLKWSAAQKILKKKWVAASLQSCSRRLGALVHTN